MEKAAYKKSKISKILKPETRPETRFSKHFLHFKSWWINKTKLSKETPVCAHSKNNIGHISIQNVHTDTLHKPHLAYTHRNAINLHTQHINQHIHRIQFKAKTSLAWVDLIFSSCSGVILRGRPLLDAVPNTDGFDAGSTFLDLATIVLPLPVSSMMRLIGQPIAPNVVKQHLDVKRLPNSPCGFAPRATTHYAILNRSRSSFPLTWSEADIGNHKADMCASGHRRRSNPVLGVLGVEGVTRSGARLEKLSVVRYAWQASANICLFPRRLRFVDCSNF